MTKVPYLLLLLCGFAGTAQAQNTGGVFGPVVEAGERSAELRVGWDPKTERFVERVHYQHAVSGDVRLRGIIQVRHGNGRDGVEFDNFQAQLLWQLTPDSQKKWQSGLRFDALIRGQGRPEQLRIGWTNQFDLGGGTRLRAIIIAGRELGDGREAGLTLETRESVSFRLSPTIRLEADHFGQYGTTADILDLDDQTHQLGPALEVKLAGDWSLGSRALFGLTDASPDAQLLFSIGKGF